MTGWSTRSDVLLASGSRRDSLQLGTSDGVLSHGLASCGAMEDLCRFVYCVRRSANVNLHAVGL